MIQLRWIPATHKYWMDSCALLFAKGGGGLALLLHQCNSWYTLYLLLFCCLIYKSTVQWISTDFKYSMHSSFHVCLSIGGSLLANSTEAWNSTSMQLCWVEWQNVFPILVSYIVNGSYSIYGACTSSCASLFTWKVRYSRMILTAKPAWTILLSQLPRVHACYILHL